MANVHNASRNVSFVGTIFEPWFHDVALPPPFEREMATLCRKLIADREADECRTFQFLGVQPEDGASSVCLGLAHMAAFRFGLRVLLVEADPPGRDRDRLIVRRAPAADGGLPGGFPPGGIPPGGISDELRPRSEDSLLVTSLWSREGPEDSPISTGRLHLLLSLQNRFDLLLIDSNSSAFSAEGQLIAGLVHGVVLVLNAAEGFMGIADAVNRRLSASGASVAGLVLNRFA
ncbi:hypothetical protein [Azospirillum sp. sgz302134]